MVVIQPKKRLNDSRGYPGELVMLRGIAGASIWREPRNTNSAGIVIPGSIGMIICCDEKYKQYTYVLWSNPCLCGWIEDGRLRRI